MKKIISIFFAVVMVLGLVACSKPVELDKSNYSDYLKIKFEVYSSYSLTKNSNSYYVSHALDDSEITYYYGFVYDKLQIPFEIKGASDYVFENAEVTLKLTGDVQNIYQCHVDDGSSSSKAKKKSVSETVTVKLDSNGKADVKITINGWGSLNDVNGIYNWSAFDIEVTSVKGTVTEK